MLNQRSWIRLNLLLFKQRGSLASGDFLWAGLRGEASSLPSKSSSRADEHSSHKRYRGMNVSS